eukprot:gene2738-12610_t
MLVTAGFCPNPNPCLPTYPNAAKLAYLSQCAQVMQPVGRRWRLAMAMAQWQEVVSFMQRAKGEEARHVVLARAVIRYVDSCNSIFVTVYFMQRAKGQEARHVMLARAVIRYVDSCNSIFVTVYFMQRAKGQEALPVVLARAVIRYVDSCNSIFVTLYFMHRAKGEEARHAVLARAVFW